MKNNNTRLIVLIVLAILAGMLFILTIIPNSPLVEKDYCMDTEQAAVMYASKDPTEKQKFTEKRNSQCKTLLKYAVNRKSVYEQLENCTLLDAAMDASDHYIEMKKDKSNAVKSQIDDMEKIVAPFTYCPQYNDVIDALKKHKETSN